MEKGKREALNPKMVISKCEDLFVESKSHNQIGENQKCDILRITEEKKARENEGDGFSDEFEDDEEEWGDLDGSPIPFLPIKGGIPKDEVSKKEIPQSNVWICRCDTSNS